MAWLTYTAWMSHPEHGTDFSQTSSLGYSLQVNKLLTPRGEGKFYREEVLKVVASLIGYVTFTQEVNL